jgi:hypothetical protein
VKTIIQFGCAVLLMLLVVTPVFAQHGSYYGPNFYRNTASLYRPYGPYFTTGGIYGPSVLFYPRRYSYHGANRTRLYNVDQLYEHRNTDEESR